MLFAHQRALSYLPLFLSFFIFFTSIFILIPNIISTKWVLRFERLAQFDFLFFLSKLILIGLLKVSHLFFHGFLVVCIGHHSELKHGEGGRRVKPHPNYVAFNRGDTLRFLLFAWGPSQGERLPFVSGHFETDRVFILGILKAFDLGDLAHNLLCAAFDVVFIVPAVFGITAVHHSVDRAAVWKS